MTEQSLGPVSIGDEPAMATAEFSKLLGPPQREGEAPTECMGTGPVDSQMVSWPGLTIISIDEGSGVRVYSISLNSQGTWADQRRLDFGLDPKSPNCSTSIQTRQANEMTTHRSKVLPTTWAGR
ncbi:MAG: hypothetical protein IPI82_06890 [Candidatus Microthrix sp.]|nr:hypothetical protein [Candidatus Microthrix sp.]MBK7322170.1 hypothetical protein [Candidatus Microthrix sp.]